MTPVFDAPVDVLVLGLGPAGASAAAEAARAGACVLAVDRKHVAGVPVQCAEFVPAMIGTEVRTLASTVRQRITAMATFVEDDAPDIQDHFPGHMLDRAAFDAELVRDAEAAGAHCALGMPARAIAPDGMVTFADGRTISPGIIVGADGPRSLAGRAIGQINADLVETRQITVALKRPHTATDIFLSADIPGGYGWLFPAGALANVGAGVAPAHQRRLKAIVRQLHQQLLAQDRVGADVLTLTGGPIPVGGLLRPWGDLGSTRVLLAGDAAGLANPVTGAGISAAVQSGKLAGAAAAALLNGAPDAHLNYADELEALFGTALARAKRHRETLAIARPDKDRLRRGWIAYPQYWAV